MQIQSRDHSIVPRSSSQELSSTGLSPQQSAPPGPELAGARAHQAIRTSTLPATLIETTVREHFQGHFDRAARSSEAFHSLMRQAFGNSYDRGAAEQLRQRAVAGDFSWLPNVKFVSNDTLGGANGAYDADSQTVFLNAGKGNNWQTLAATFMEEVGHHIDTMVNRGDSAGDEGEIFRRTLLGETLSSAELARVRGENDHGTIVVDGKTVAVEFWSLSDVGDAIAGAVSKGVKSASSAVSTGASAIGNAIWDATSRCTPALWNAASGFGHDVWELTKQLGGAAWDMTGGFFGTLFTTGPMAAWDQLNSGADALLYRIPARGLSMTLDRADELSRSAEQALPFPWARDAVGALRSRTMDASRSLVMGGFGAAAGVVRNLSEAGGNMARGAYQLSQGDLSGFTELGRGALKVVQTPIDAVIMIGGSTISAVQTMTFLEEPGRPLSKEEVRELRPIYGNSVDYDLIRVKEGNAALLGVGGRAFTLGNTIYMNGAEDTPGTALREDLNTLVSEVTHVWQYQNGGTDYASEALLSQAAGDSYDWRKDVPGTPWGELEPEQQDAFLAYAHALGAFTRSPPAFDASGVPAGMTLAELNQYLTDSLATIREGRGTP